MLTLQQRLDLYRMRELIAIIFHLTEFRCTRSESTNAKKQTHHGDKID